MAPVDSLAMVHSGLSSISMLVRELNGHRKNLMRKSFASLGTNVNYVVGSNGRATVETSGLYLVYVDMNRNLITFEKPAVYGIGECFDDRKYRSIFPGRISLLSLQHKAIFRCMQLPDYNNRD